MRFHQHRWRASTGFGVLHGVCVKCGRVSLDPRWPFWRVAPRYEPTPENVEKPSLMQVVFNSVEKAKADRRTRTDNVEERNE